MRKTYKAMCVSVRYSDFYTRNFGMEDLKGYSLQVILIEENGESMRRTMSEIACYGRYVEKGDDGRIHTIRLEDPIYADRDGQRPIDIDIKVRPGERSYIYLRAKGIEPKIYKRTGKQKFTPGKNSIPVVRLRDPRIVGHEPLVEVVKPACIEALSEVEVEECLKN